MPVHALRSTSAVLVALLACCLVDSGAPRAGALTGADDEPARLDAAPLPGGESPVPVDGPVTLPSNPAYLDQPLEPEPRGPQPAASEAKPADATSPADEKSPPGKAPSADEASPAKAQPPEAAEKQPAEQTRPEAPPAVAPRRELSAAQIALRDRVRRILLAFYRDSLNTEVNTVTDVMRACLAYGCDTEVIRGNQRVNGITCLCWNYPCGGFEPFAICERHIAGRVGYGLQERPGELLAVLALARVPSDYPVRVGQDVRTVADLVAHEKLACRSGADMSWPLVALAYVAEPSWQNDQGEAWTIERIVGQEMGRPIAASPDGGTTRLIGISAALECQVRRGRPLDGQFGRAVKFINDFHNFALGLQNADGSWSPYFFAARGTTRDPVAQLRSTGRILEWLAMSLPDQRLDDPHAVRAVEYVLTALGNQRYQSAIRGLNSRELATVMHALHGLSVYDDRCFKPADEPKADPNPTPPEKTSAAYEPASAARAR